MRPRHFFISNCDKEKQTISIMHQGMPGGFLVDVRLQENDMVSQGSGHLACCRQHGLAA